MPESSEEERALEAAENKGLYTAGVWTLDAFDEILEKIALISKEIEIEFRRIYGTYE